MPKKLDRYEFIWKAIQIHGYKYDYRKVNYINSQTKVCIICPKHGEFWQRPIYHLQKCICPLCSNNVKLTVDEFIKKAKETHGNKYDYSKVKYVNNHTKVCIICRKHGEFWQKPNHHINGFGCSKCSEKFLDKKSFIEKSKEVHGNKYDYSKIEYKNSKTKICIICSKHGEFWQRPNDHLSGYGCPICKESTLEKEIALFLDENNIKYERQKRFKWLGLQSLDFYLPDYNIAIECQGIQHFKPFSYFGGDDIFKLNIKRDKNKIFLCKENNIKLLHYTIVNYPKDFNLYKLITDKYDLLKEINTQLSTI